MASSDLLNVREQELVALGASFAAGCRPCAAYHVRAARTAGASEQDLRRAVSDALEVRQRALEIMAELAKDRLDLAPAPDGPADADPLLAELVSAGAALSVNCVASLEAHLRAAWRLGATERQIQTVVDVARAVRSMAQQQADQVLGQLAAASQHCGSACGSRAATSRPPAAAAACCDDPAACASA